MWNKIAFLCADPWESFLPSAFQSCGREYYQWIQEMTVLREVNSYCREHLEIYGETEVSGGAELFPECRKCLQLLYVQSGRRQMIEQVFQKADVVIMGLPGCKKEFDKIFMRIFPWKDQIKFFWNSHICRDEKFIKELCREYKLHDAQIFEIKRSVDGKLENPFISGIC